MPYGAGQRLPREKASKLGHLEVLKSDLVKKLCQSFEDPNAAPISSSSTWELICPQGDPLPLIFSVDGSFQLIKSETPPHKALAFIKTALLRMDQPALSKIDPDTPHPFALRDILEESALYHATVFPLRHVIIPGLCTYDAIRQIIFESIKDASLDEEPMSTLKWLAYKKWDTPSPLDKFGCPHCEQTVATLPVDAEEGECPGCKGHIFITDMLGFHLDMTHDSAPDTIPKTYMTIHETLLLFTGIRYFWENNKTLLTNCLFVKDGPLSIRAQYSKLVNPIRRFLSFAKSKGCPIHLIGQEKSGTFYDHLQLIGNSASVNSLFIPGDKYIKEEIQNRPDRGHPYGKDTNYGAKVFVKLNSFHKMVLNVPTGNYVKDPVINDLIGSGRIFATIPSIISNRFEGALLPIELANGVASLSTYPSAQILKIFADTKGESGN